MQNAALPQMAADRLPDGRVTGEVYLISENMLPKMDKYEEEGTLYHRKKVQVENNEGQFTVWAYVYAAEIDGIPMNRMWGSRPEE